MPNPIQQQCVLLDRDGVINEAPTNRYITDVAEVSLIDGVGAAIAAFNENGFSVLVVSNQQCVGHGLLTEEGLKAISECIVAGIRALGGGEIRDFFYCPHLADAHCDCRKPKPGLIHQAHKKYGFDCEQTYVIGDSYTDLEAGVSAGCPAILVLTGNDAPRYRAGDPPSTPPEYVASDLLDAAHYIIGKQ